MTAPTLSPAELDEVRRFGAHDEEIVERMDERLDRACEIGACATDASHLRVTRCCWHPKYLCDEHLVRGRVWHDHLGNIPGARAVCNYCPTIWPGPLSFDLLYAVMPL